MNIVVDIRCLTQQKRTGVGEYTYELLDALFMLESQHRYILFYNSFKDISDIVPQWNQHNVTYVVTRWPSKLLNALIWLRVIKLDRFIQKHIKNHDQIDFFFAPNINFIHLSKHIKLLLTIHDLSFEFFKECYSWKRRIWHWLVRPKKLCNRAYCVITPSDSTRHDVMLEYGIHGDKIQRIYPGLSKAFVENGHATVVNKKRIQEKYALPKEYILYLGTLEPRKNIDLILDSYARLNSRDRRIPLVIAGGRGWHYHRIIRRIDQIPQVRYIGYVDHLDKMALYDMARAFVFPSLYEGFGFPVLEAMSRGVPVVTSNRSSLPEVIGDAGYLINSHDIVGLSHGLHRILNHPQYYDTIGKIAQKRSRQFRWSRAAQEFLDIIT